MGLLLPSLAALVSLLILPGWSFYFDVIPKVVMVLAGAAMVLLLPWAWPRSRRVKWLFGILAAQAILLVVATAFSTQRWFSFYGSTWRRSGVLAELAVLILAAAAAGNVRGRLRLWLRIMVLAGLPVAIYAIFQYFGMDPLMDAAGYRFGEGRFMIVRPPGTLGHAAYLATYLLFIVFGGAALARMEIISVWKWVALATCGVAFFAIVLSGTRAALVGLVAGALFIAVRERVNRKWLAGAAGLTILLGGFYLSPAGERLRARVFWSSEDALGGSRLLLWRDALRMSTGRWLVGYGPETFAREFPLHTSIELARAYPDSYQESPHNIFIDALVSDGVGGLAALVALVALGLAVARGAMGGAFVAMLVSQQFTSFTIPTELYFYLCVAILAGESAGVAVKRRMWIGWILAIPFAGFALYLGSGDLLLGSARRALDHGRPGPATRLVGRARERNASADEYFSRRFLAVKIWPDAIVAAATAPKTADDPQNALVNLAAFEATVNDAAGVEQTLRQAIAASPNWYKPHWLLAQVLELGGRMAEAKVEAQAAADRDGGKHPEVQQTLERVRSR
jgi:O-antigen ligase